MIGPHGKRVVNCSAGGEKATALEVEARKLKITPLSFKHAFYCRECAGMASQKTCGHDKQSRVMLSGTQVRAVLREGEQLPVEFTRPEVAAVLHQAFGQQQKRAGWSG